MKIHCANFAEEEVGALRRLLVLLASHLHYPWEVVADSVSADLVIVNRDLPGEPHASTGARIVGCSARPAAHPNAKLHRPLRAYELLTALSDLRPTPVETARDAGIEARRYRLREWPLDLAAWSRQQITVMASISRDSHAASEIALRTGVSRVVVEECLQALTREGLLEREQASRTATPIPQAPGRWQQLAQRVGQLLGFR